MCLEFLMTAVEFSFCLSDFLFCVFLSTDVLLKQMKNKAFDLCWLLYISNILHKGEADIPFQNGACRLQIEENP